MNNLIKKYYDHIGRMPNLVYLQQEFPRATKEELEKAIKEFENVMLS